MRRTVTLLVLMAACGGAAPDPGPTPGPSTIDSASPSPTVTVGFATTTTTEVGSPTTASPNRDAAPDFTLQLGDGGSYTLSEGAKPVYLVFWAEW
ncbi:MAG: hypothetical protein R3258_06830 [Acidimicrobiia bacterium]|nr:hypothetical protein [Acidimicrobiia bacterium]